MSDHPNIAFLIVSGPEVRSFIHSGLLKFVSEKYDTVIITSVLSSQVFTTLQDVSVVDIPPLSECAWLSRLRYYARRAHEKWLEDSSGWNSWRHTVRGSSRTAHKRYPGTRLAWYWINELLRKIEQVSGRIFGTDPRWRRIFEAHSIDMLIVGTHSSPRVLSALQTAKNMGICTLIILNSWKDVFVNPHLSVFPDVLFVWGEESNLALSRANPDFPPDSMVKINSLHLQKFLFGGDYYSYDELCRLTGLSPKRPYFCYTAAAPSATIAEEQIVEAILKAIEEAKMIPQPQMLLRLNPMEDGQRFSELQQCYGSNLVIQKPIWEWNQSIDWCCPLIEDSILWYSTAYHSIMNISIPSTVTMEFLALRKPVVNICFDAIDNQPSEKSNTRFWNAEFYRGVRNSRLVKPAQSIEEAVNWIKEYINKDEENLTEDSLFLLSQPVEDVARVIDDLLRQS